jgi:hypothetical protein
MTTWDIWAEGHNDMGNIANAQKLNPAPIEAASFDDAVRQHVATKSQSRPTLAARPTLATTAGMKMVIGVCGRAGFTLMRRRPVSSWASPTQIRKNGPHPRDEGGGRLARLGCVFAGVGDPRLKVRVCGDERDVHGPAQGRCRPGCCAAPRRLRRRAFRP